MDRFIDPHAKMPLKRSVYLKSNMDRFIVSADFLLGNDK